MATYKGIQGFSVEKLSSDPSTVIQGKLFYNDTSNVFKIGAAGTAAWASGPSCVNGRNHQGTAGLQTAAIVALGGIPGSPPSTHTATAKSESFNGTSWTEVADCNTARINVWAGGTQTATIFGQGNPAGGTAVETYNGTSWTTSPATTVNDSYTRCYGGTSTVGVAFGGGSPMTATEIWDGTTWTEVNDLNTGRAQLSGGGTSTAAIGVCGGVANPPPPSRAATTLCETWNGTSWTEVNNANDNYMWRSGWGIQTAAMVCGGHRGGAPVTNLSESWDGTSWTNTANLGATRYAGGPGCGTQALGMITGGMPTTSGVGTTATEQWFESPISAQTVTTS